MAISTYKIFLMQKNEDAWEKSTAMSCPLPSEGCDPL